MYEIYETDPNLQIKLINLIIIGPVNLHCKYIIPFFVIHEYVYNHTCVHTTIIYFKYTLHIQKLCLIHIYVLA